MNLNRRRAAGAHRPVQPIMAENFFGGHIFTDRNSVASE
jgi:hypothetical protein